MMRIRPLVCLGIASAKTKAIALFVLVVVGRARLLRGKTAIARWHVSAAEWDRLRAISPAL